MNKKNLDKENIKKNGKMFFDLEFENFRREAVFTANLNIKDRKNFVEVSIDSCRKF